MATAAALSQFKYEVFAKSDRPLSCLEHLVYASNYVDWLLPVHLVRLATLWHSARSGLSPHTCLLAQMCYWDNARRSCIFLRMHVRCVPLSCLCGLRGIIACGIAAFRQNGHSKDPCTSRPRASLVYNDKTVVACSFSIFR